MRSIDLVVYVSETLPDSYLVTLLPNLPSDHTVPKTLDPTGVDRTLVKNRALEVTCRRLVSETEGFQTRAKNETLTDRYTQTCSGTWRNWEAKVLACVFGLSDLTTLLGIPFVH